ncbi:hypothetical protein F7725_015432 [Dissostichus mawsoni]|uniref:Hsp90 co-chaperone Cdc37-like 1 n=1 Tax=Dissostichus mawsoni TaxID=36200 RepID=A0A7J5YHK9_DISMA|nr:hypothetical protein F7725_015432 [Dissostichus mawsoni]
MEWLGNSALLHDEESSSDPAPAANGFSGVHPHQQSPLSHRCDCAMASLCQGRCVKASIVSSWRLAEAQDQLCSLGVHSSESLEQERARTMACPTELTHTEEEWRRKESMLGGQEPPQSCARSCQVLSMFNINLKIWIRKSARRFFKSMLHRWDDSQRFLAEMPQIICEETANYLILWCMRLQQEGKEALMEQVAHQAVVMRFILEMASTSQQDPRGCFRHFFHKAKEGQDVYLEVFHSELEAFKQRVRESAVRSRCEALHNVEPQQSDTNCRVKPKEALDSFPIKRYIEDGLWTSTGRWTKNDAAETDDIRMMETS